MMAPFRVIRTYLPMNSAQGVQCLVSDAALSIECPRFKPLLEMVRRYDPIGRVGNYTAVYGIALAAGGDIPLAGSHPQRIATGDANSTAVLAFTTYAAADVPNADVHAFAEELAAWHPWDHPVIEITVAELWMP